MQDKITGSWKHILKNEFKKTYFKNLEKFVINEYSNYTCYPKFNLIFSSFDLCIYSKVKVVIIGQDPYHGKGQANGLCFSVNKGITFPPSLVNIFKEIVDDIGVPYPNSGDLSRWAKQGVLLLNSTLTVRDSLAKSHQKQGWETFTDAIISMLSKEKENIVFLLWGNYAKEKETLINKKKHCVLLSGHPSPLSANRGFWFGNNHFSKANKFLESKNKQPIEW